MKETKGNLSVSESKNKKLIAVILFGEGKKIPVPKEYRISKEFDGKECVFHREGGKIVKIEEHPVSPLSSSGAHYIVYHIEYQINSALLGANKGKGWVEPGKGPKYLLQISEFRYSPKFKVGDSVQLTGWIEKIKLNKVASPNGETADANSP